MGGLQEAINFGFLLGESGWRAKQAELYRQLNVRSMRDCCYAGGMCTRQRQT